MRKINFLFGRSVQRNRRGVAVTKFRPICTQLFMGCSVMFGLSVVLGGCIVGEIRDSLAHMNQKLGEVETSLGQLDTTNRELEKSNSNVNESTAGVERVSSGLVRLDSTNLLLEGVNTRLAAMGESLARVDIHLLSLRTTMSNIDDVVPFVEFASDAPQEAATSVAEGKDIPVTGAASAEPAAGQEIASAPDAAPTEPVVNRNAGEPAQASGKAKGAGGQAAETRRDAVVGTWEMVYPTRGSACVLLADGRYILSSLADGVFSKGVERGKWQRGADRASIEFVRGSTNSAQALRARVPEPSAGWSMPVISLTGRTLTAELRGDLVVWTRP